MAGWRCLRLTCFKNRKSLNALRQLIDEVYGGRFQGLYLLVTGTPAFFDGPQGVQRLPPLAQRLHVEFGPEDRFDNPRAVQIRLPGFDRLRAALRTQRQFMAAPATVSNQIRSKGRHRLIVVERDGSWLVCRQ